MFRPGHSKLLWCSTLSILLLSNGSLANHDCNNLYQWSSSITFSTGNMVRDKGIAYKAKRQTTGETPLRDSAAWQFIGMCDSATQIACDFNGDGLLDAAKGFPAADLVSGKSNGGIPNTSGLINAGEVGIFYNINPADKPADQVWNQNGLGMFAYARRYARFGDELVSGDFNNDQFCDLAIGSPDFSMDPADNQQGKGTVNILYGSPSGLTTMVLGENGRPVNPNDGQRFDQDHPDIQGAAEPDDHFGSVMASGDINGDGVDDLAVGSYAEDINVGPTNVTNAGYLHVIYGSTHGLQTTQPKVAGYHQGFGTGSQAEIEAYDMFGGAIAVADFDHDGFADIVVAAPGENSTRGKVSLFNGSSTGIVAASRKDVTAADFPTIDHHTAHYFGRIMRALDVNNDGFVDLEIEYFDEGSLSLIKTLQIPGSASGLVF